MLSETATSGRAAPRGHRRRLCTTALVTGLAGALALGQAGVAAATPTALGVTQTRAASTSTGRVLPVVHRENPNKQSNAVVRYGHAAFPSATRLANGALLVVYREGPNHFRVRDGFIRSTTSTDGGATWSRPATVIPTSPGLDYRDPSISTSNNGATLYLTYFKATRWNGAGGSFFRSSTTGGATWTPEVRIDPNLAFSAITAPAVQLADGSLVAVHYSRRADERRDSVWFSRSTNGGASWTTTRLIDGQTADRDYQEPYLVRRGDHLFLTFRWGHKDSIGSMSSSNSGATWSTPAAAFPGTGRPSSVWLADGTIVVYLRDSGGNFDVRSTPDEGTSWGPVRWVQSPPPGGRSTYASFVEVSPGSVFTVMTAEDATGTRSRMTFTHLTG